METKGQKSEKIETLLAEYRGLISTKSKAIQAGDEAVILATIARQDDIEAELRNLGRSL